MVISRKFLNIIVSVMVVASLLFGSGGPTALGFKPGLAQAQTNAAAATVATDETKVPHYFGPYPNWANSPQVLANAVVTIGLGTPTPVSYGNLPLKARAYATDFATGPLTLGPVFVVIPSAVLPDGTLNNFQTWNQALPGGSPTPSTGGWFYAYVLRPDPFITNQYEVVYADSVNREVPPLTDPAVGEVATFPVAPGVAVQANDVIAFYGQGVPVDTDTGTDVLSYPAPVAPGPAGSIITVGDPATFPIYPQARTYSFAATVTPTVTDPGTGAQATATVDPKTGSISAITVTSPGAGYLYPPTVSISAVAGATPTKLASAAAVISLGVVNSIAVNETGFGFTAPAVTFAGGTPTTVATAQASGGVDNVTVFSGGLGYDPNAYVVFDLPNLPSGVQATGSLVIDGNGTITGVNVTNPGSGYTSAPGVSIIEPTSGLPITAVAGVVATIGIGQIDVTSGGQGYDSAPTVTILDVGGVDRFASATANVAVKGAVTAINLTAPNFGGLGYLTPGIKKFVDPLPGLCDPNSTANVGVLGPLCPTDPAAKTIPLAVAEPLLGADYYEIAVVQYRMKFSSQLPATLLRGYVQLETAANGSLGSNVSQHFPLVNEMLNGPAQPVMLNGSQVYAVTPPHYLGPTIVASKDKPVRILFRNLLPKDVAGNLFLPVDTSLMGAGMGPDMVTLDANNVPTDPPGMDQDAVTDGVRNPACGETPKPMDCFSENRATLHLHGGITPWISDGTPHQWTTPAGENTSYPEGVSVSNVPDMPDPGPGALTFFYTNQQSARLMFYHDHAWGITRLNVYAGEAAGYVLTDGMETTLISAGGALAGLSYGTPLVIQDKTFVPSAAKMAQLDPTWDAARWGGEGSLWTPHVYMPAQNPGDPSGMSSFGRWMYGPWFWPPAQNAKYPPIANPYYNMDPNAVPPFSQPLAVPCNLDVPATWQYQSDPFCEPALIPSTPNLSVGMEAFNDTPIVNGTVYPATTVDPKAYRFRILNAANDRFWNLSWYVADPRTGTLSEVALNPVELAAAQTDPVVSPTPDTVWSPAGPNWIQIGSEGGFLPTPVVIPAGPTVFITDPTRFDVGNVDYGSLILAPAERADVIVDFSQFRGKTLILYNDAPAAFPARVPGYDYYSGGPDLSPAGAPTTLPGYGPNTRTIMKVTVSTAAPDLAFDRPNTTADRLGALMTAFGHKADGSGVFESGSDPIIVGQAAYNSAYGSNFAASGWCNSPTNPSAQCDGFARIMEQGGDLFKFNTLGPLQNGAGPQLQIPFQPKGLHDEMNSANFDDWGRMTANLGLEAPGATPLLQNIILYPFVNPSTENLDSSGLPSGLNVTPIASAADGTQIWKITHNGVDTHPIHFHLYDVQVINRVTWDNIIIPPFANELGWKDTVRISPLEDTIVAVRPIVPVLPFAVPDSRRPLNPMMPARDPLVPGSPPGARGDLNTNGTEAGFNNTDVNGNPMTVAIENLVTDFGWEYVYHCHILSHEEMDMMRPVTVFVARALPVAPVLTFAPGSVILNWTDGTSVNYAVPTTWANPNNEIGFRIERAIGTGPFAPLSTALANVTTFTDLSASTTDGVSYQYRVIAFNAAGEVASNVVLVGPPLAPSNLVATAFSPTQINLTWADNAGNEDGFTIQRATTSDFSGPSLTTITLNGADQTSYSDMGLTGNTTYYYRVQAFNAAGPSAWSNTASATTPNALPAAPSNLVATAVSSTRINLTWTDNANNETGFTIQRATTPNFNGGTVTITLNGANLTSYSNTGRTPSTTYYYRVRAFNAAGPSATWSNTASATTPSALPAAPTDLLGAAVRIQGNNQQDRVLLTWTDNANNETGFQIQRSTSANFNNSTTYNVGVNVISFFQNVSRTQDYYYRVRATNAAGNSAWSNRVFVTTP